MASAAPSISADPVYTDCINPIGGAGPGGERHGSKDVAQGRCDARNGLIPTATVCRRRLGQTVYSLLRGLGTQVTWALWPAGVALGGERKSGGSRARATGRRSPGRCRASRAAPPNRARSRHLYAAWHV
jgi:hypothetical protein